MSLFIQQKSLVMFKGDNMKAEDQEVLLHEEEDRNLVQSDEETEAELQEMVEKESHLYEEYTKDRSVIINHFTGSINAPFSAGDGDVRLNEGNESYSAAYRVAKQELEKVLSVYVSFPEEETVLRQLKESHLVILVGDRHIGKYTASLMILNHQKVEQINQLFPLITVEQLSTHSFESHTGYVVDGIVAETLYALNEQTLTFISHRLKQVNSYLVITAIGNTMPNLKEFNVSLSGPSSIHRVLEKHLYIHLDPFEILEAINLLENNRLQTVLGNYISPRMADEIAIKLGKIVRDEMSFEQFEASFFPNVEKELEEWFRHHENLEESTFMLSLALFNGHSYHLITKTAGDLKRILLNNGFESLKPKSVFSYTKPRLLEVVGAEQFTGSILTETGRSPTKCFRLKQEKKAELIYSYVWSCLPLLQSSLITWFKGIVENGNKIESISVAHAISELIIQLPGEFEFLKKELLNNWAKSPQPIQRMTVVQTLSEMAHNKENLPQIARILRRWISSNHPNMQWTACAAYGTHIGLNLSGQALEDLTKLNRIGQKRFYPIVSRVLTTIFTTSYEDTVKSELVLDFLLWWSEKEREKDRPRNHHPLKHFLSLMKTKNESIILNLLEQHTIRREKVGRLFGLGIDDSETSEKTMEVIETLILHSDEYPKLYEPIEKLVIGIMVDSKRGEKKMLQLFTRSTELMESSSGIKIIKNIIEDEV